MLGHFTSISEAIQGVSLCCRVFNSGRFKRFHTGLGELRRPNGDHNNNGSRGFERYFNAIWGNSEDFKEALRGCVSQKLPKSLGGDS